MVTLDPDAMTAMNLRALDVSRAIAASDSKVSAGLLRSSSDNILLEVAGELDTLTRIGGIPIQLGAGSNFVELADVARIEKTTRLPLETKMLLQEHEAVAVGVQIQSETRIDVWSNSLDEMLAEFEERLPSGVTLERVFQQNRYVSARTTSLFRNLIYGAAAIFVVILFMMGWRAAWIVGSALPLVSLAVLAAMYWLEIPIHQMSITGLIIALGLMIDNAIVVVDEISQRLREGKSRVEAVERSTSFLLMPLIGSTLTTALSFSPIILMDGGAGEFVGSIAIVAVVAVASSFVLAMTVIASVAGLGAVRILGHNVAQQRGILALVNRRVRMADRAGAAEPACWCAGRRRTPRPGICRRSGLAGGVLPTVRTQPVSRRLGTTSHLVDRRDGTPCEGGWQAITGRRARDGREMVPRKERTDVLLQRHSSASKCTPIWPGDC